jgi:hypothetical protein
MKRWDVFLSHAREDKEAVALPLAECLVKAGLRVWLDTRRLQLGDSLREKIDEGLAGSRFAVIILSKRFLEKVWPKRELNALMALEEGGRHVILPVWHEITKAELASYSPILADRLAVDTSQGIAEAAKAIIEVVISPGSDSPALRLPSAARLLLNLLEQNPTREKIIDFLVYHPKLVQCAGLDSVGRDSWVTTGDTAGFAGVPFCVISERHTHESNIVTFIEFADVSGPLLHADGSFASDIRARMAALSSLLKIKRLADPQLFEVSVEPWFQTLHYGPTNFYGVIYARRREQLSPPDRAFLRQHAKKHWRGHDESDLPILISSYDRLVEYALSRNFGGL